MSHVPENVQYATCRKCHAELEIQEVKDSSGCCPLCGSDNLNFVEKSIHNNTKDPWTVTWGVGSVHVYFNGEPVGGFGTMGKSKNTKKNQEFWGDAARREVEDCRRLHQTNPFDPGKYKNIHEWKGQTSNSVRTDMFKG